MQFSLLQENLNSALQNVSRFAQSKSQLPILGNILFATDSGRLKLTATNLELGINYWIGAKIDAEGSFTIPAKELVEFVSYLPSGKLDFDLNENNLLTVQSPKAKSVFTTTPVSDFPVLPSINPDTKVTIDSKVFSESISQVAFASATDDTRPVLTAVLCTFTSDTLSLVATDGFRLSLKHLKLTAPITLPTGSDSLTYLIPSKSLFEITKLSKNNTNLTFGVSADLHQLVFVLDDVEVVSRLIEGEFPDYQRIVPSAFASKVFINREELTQAIKIASVFARESANVVRFNIKNNLLDISANAPQVGQNSAQVDIKLEGEPLEIAFNYKFISDFLAVCKGSELIINLNESLTPVNFQDISSPDFTHIIMPVRIQD